MSIPRTSCGGWVIDAVLSPRCGRLGLPRWSATDRTLTVQRSSTPLLGHDPDTWKHWRGRRPDGRQLKLKPTPASRTQGQTDEPTRTTAIID